MRSKLRPMRPLVMSGSLESGRMTFGARRISGWLKLAGFLAASAGALWYGWLHNAGGRLFDATWPLLKPFLPL